MRFHFGGSSISFLGVFSFSLFMALRFRVGGFNLLSFLGVFIFIFIFVFFLGVFVFVLRVFAFIFRGRLCFRVRGSSFSIF